MNGSHRKVLSLGSSSARPIILDDDDASESGGHYIPERLSRRKEMRVSGVSTGSKLKYRGVEVGSGPRSTEPLPQIGRRVVQSQSLWHQHDPRASTSQYQDPFRHLPPQQFVPVQQHWAYNTYNTDFGGVYSQSHSFAQPQSQPQPQNPRPPLRQPPLVPAPSPSIPPQNVSLYMSPYSYPPVNAQKSTGNFPPFAGNQPAAYGGGAFELSGASSAGAASQRVPLIQPLPPWPRRPLKLTDFETAGDLADAILLAAGIHPTLGALNQDLRWLLDEFGPEVNEQSDLGTFRWDLGLARWLEKRNSFLRIPNSEPASHTVPPYIMENPRVIRPGDRVETHREGTKFLWSRQPSHLQESITPGTNTFSVVMNPQTQRQPVSIAPGARPILPAQSKTNMAVGRNNGTLQQTHNNFNRGPSTPRVGTPQRGTSFPRVEIPSPGSSMKKRGRPRKDPSEIPPPSSIPKKRGRPFSTPDGAAKAAAKAEGRIVRPAGPSTAGPKKRGRPFKKFEHTFIRQDPEYVPFLCEWTNCPAELVNLETLEHHVFCIHAKKRSGLFCQWAKCKAPLGGPHGHEMVPDQTPFASKAELKEHIKQEHLIPMAWHVGDGPRESSTTNSLKPPLNESWLNDSHGRQVTPSVIGQAIESGYAKLNNRKRFVKRRDSNGEIYLEPVNSEVYGKVQEPTEDEDVEIEMGTNTKGLAVVLGPVKGPEMYRKVPNEEEDDDEVDQVRMGSEMEMD